MFKRQLSLILCVLFTLSTLTFNLVTATPLTMVYANNFEGSVFKGPGIAAEWTPYKTDVTPSGRKFLGQFGKEGTVVTLRGLPSHSKLTLSFDLFIISTWDGNGKSDGTMLGPDIFDLRVIGGPTLSHTTFSNYRSWVEPSQAYPEAYPGGIHPGATGAVEINTLGYGDYHDTVYRLNYTFTHTTGSVQIKFSASTSGPAEEMFGLDNVSMSVTPAGHPAKPDLITRIVGPFTAKAGDDISSLVKVTAGNIGSAPAPGTLGALDPAHGYMIDVVLSTDLFVPPSFATYSPHFSEDVLLKGGRVSNTIDLAPLALKPYPVGAFIPADTPTGVYNLCARIDPGNKVAESNEANNVACTPIKILGSSH